MKKLLMVFLSHFSSLSQIGDWLIFDNVGAYTVTLSSNFNGLAQVPIRRLIRRDIWKAFTVPDTFWNFPVKGAVMP